MITVTDIKKYTENNGCSLKEAQKILSRRDFCQELRSGETISDIGDTLIRILNLEFGDGWDR